MMDETTAGADAEILFRVDDEVGTLTLNRPQARNALTYTMYDGLRAICEAQTREPTLRGLVITGAGDKAFAAGTDINQFRELHSADDALAYETRIEGVLDALERMGLADASMGTPRIIELNLLYLGLLTIALPNNILSEEQFERLTDGKG